MVIDTIGKDYRVTGRYPGGGSAYLCESGVNGKQYLVYEITVSELDAGAIDFLHRQTANPAFSDLADCFVDNKMLYVAFVMHSGQALPEVLCGERMSLEERIYILRKMLERAVLQNAPCFFLGRCLRAENIFITRDLDVSFLYGVAGVREQAGFDMKYAQMALRDTVELVFRDELKKEVVPPIKELLSSLETGEYADCLALYRQLTMTGIEVMRIESTELEKPKTLLFRIWGQLRKGFKPLKRIIAVVILVAVLVYMITTLRKASGDSAPARAILRIGTLEIKLEDE